MNSEDIMRMASEAGFDIDMLGWAYEQGYLEEHPILVLERFAALVAAAENEACAQWCQENFTLTTGLHYAAGIRARRKK